MKFRLCIQYQYFVLTCIMLYSPNLHLQEPQETAQFASWPRLDERTIRQVKNAYVKFFIQEARRTKYLDFQVSQYSWPDSEEFWSFFEAFIPTSMADNNVEIVGNGQSCVFGGWFSRQQENGKCVPPWYAKYRATKLHFPVYGPPCGHPNLFRCNFVLFGPGPSKAEALQLDLPEGKEVKGPNAKEAGICVKTSFNYQNLTQQCANAAEQLATLRQQQWPATMTDEERQEYQEQKLNPLGQLIQEYCQNAGAGHDPCQQLNQTLRAIRQVIVAQEAPIVLAGVSQAGQPPRSNCDSFVASPPAPGTQIPQKELWLQHKQNCAPASLFQTPSGDTLYQLLIDAIFAPTCLTNYAQWFQESQVPCPTPLLTTSKANVARGTLQINILGPKVATYEIQIPKTEEPQSIEQWQKQLPNLDQLCAIDNQETAGDLTAGAATETEEEKFTTEGEPQLTSTQELAIKNLAQDPSIKKITLTASAESGITLLVVPRDGKTFNEQEFNAKLLKLFNQQTPNNNYHIAEYRKNQEDGNLQYSLIPQPQNIKLCPSDAPSILTREVGEEPLSITLEATISNQAGKRPQLVLELLTEKLMLDFQTTCLDNDQSDQSECLAPEEKNYFSPKNQAHFFTLNGKEYASFELSVNPQTKKCTLHLTHRQPSTAHPVTSNPPIAEQRAETAEVPPVTVQTYLLQKKAQCAPDAFFNTPNGANLYPLLVATITQAACAANYPQWFQNIDQACETPILSIDFSPTGKAGLRPLTVTFKGFTNTSYTLLIDESKTLGPQEWTALLQKADGNFALSCFTAEQRKSRLAIIPNTAVTAEQAAQLSDLARQQAIAMITGSVTGDQDLTLSITPESKYQPWNTQALYHALVQIFPDQHYEKKDAKCQNVPPYDCTLTLRPIQNGQIAPSSVNLTPAEETAIKTREDHLKNIVEKNADRKKKYTPISRDILQQVGTQLPSKEDKWEFTYTNARGEVFYLAEGVWENYQYGGHDDGETARPALSRVISFWQKGAEGLVRGTLPVRDFCKKNGIKITCNPQDFQQKIDDKIAQAKDTFTSEEQNTQIVRSLDLPKDAKIAHLALFPTDYRTEPVISGIADDPIATNALLKKAGYQIAPPQIIATASPKAALTAAVKQALREGKREIYLDLVGHGNAQGVHFGTEPGAILKGSDLMEIINEATSSHPGVHFVINSVACHGGGFRRDFYDQFISGHPQAKTKVDLILQGKPDATNEEAVNTDGRPLSTYFNLFYLQALAKMGTTESIKIRGEEFPIKTIGDAIRYADVMSGQYTHANAEVIQHQKQQVALSKSIGPLPDPQ